MAEGALSPCLPPTLTSETLLNTAPSTSACSDHQVSECQAALLRPSTGSITCIDLWQIFKISNELNASYCTIQAQVKEWVVGCKLRLDSVHSAAHCVHNKGFTSSYGIITLTGWWGTFWVTLHSSLQTQEEVWEGGRRGGHRGGHWQRGRGLSPHPLQLQHR